MNDHHGEFRNREGHICPRCGEAVHDWTAHTCHHNPDGTLPPHPSDPDPQEY